MGAAAVKYAGASRSRAGACCEACGRPYTCGNGAVVCGRCTGVTCRACYSRSCVFHVGGATLGLPVTLSQHAVCDGCGPDAEREARFAAGALPLLTGGVPAQRVPTTMQLLSGLGVGISGAGLGKEMVMVSVDVARRALLWRTLQMVLNTPRASGDVPLDDVALPLLPVHLPGAAGAGSGSGGGGAGGSMRSGGGSDVGLAGALAFKLTSARGATLLQLSCTDARAAARLATAIQDAVLVSRLPHGRVFPPRGGAAAAGGAGGAPGAASSAAAASAAASGPSAASAAAGRLDASAAARAERAREREAFRASLGHVGMTHTARIMAGGAGAASAAMSDADEGDDGAHTEEAGLTGGARGYNDGAGGGGGSGGGGMGAGGSWQGSVRLNAPPASGAANAKRDSLRTGNLDADRVLNGAVASLATLGTSARSFFTSFSTPPPAAGDSDAGAGMRVAGTGGLRSRSGSIVGGSTSNGGAVGAGGSVVSSTDDGDEDTSSLLLRGRGDSGAADGADVGSASKSLRPARQGVGRGSAHAVSVGAAGGTAPCAPASAGLSAASGVGASIGSRFSSAIASVSSGGGAQPGAAAGGSGVGGIKGLARTLSLASVLDRAAAAVAGGSGGVGPSWFVDEAPPAPAAGPGGAARPPRPASARLAPQGSGAASGAPTGRAVDGGSGGGGGNGGAAVSAAPAGVAGPPAGQIFKAGRKFGGGV